MYGFGHYGMGWGGVGMLIFWVLVIVGIVFLLRQNSGSREPTVRQTPLEILEARYARGEIEREDFITRRADLQRDDPAR